MANRWENSDWLYFLEPQTHCKWLLQAWNWKTLGPLKKSCDKPRQHIKKQRHYFVNKGRSSQSYGSSGSHVWMWELDLKESWILKNWCFWTVVLEKTLESLGLQGDQMSQSWRKAVLNIHWKVWCWNWSSQYFRHLMWRTDSLGKPWMLGKTEGGRRRGQQRMRWLDGITDSRTWVWASFGSWWWTGRPGVLQSVGSQRVRHDWVTELNWVVLYLLK